MSIAFTCACGKRLTMADEWAGKKARCPACKEVLTVPGTAPEPRGIVADPVPVPVRRPVDEPAPTPPAATRVWLYPGSGENSLLALTDDTLWVRSTVFTTVRPEATRIEAGDDPSAVLGPDAVSIPLDEVYRVEADRRRDNLCVSYQETTKEGKRENRSREFFVEDKAIRDEVFDALRERLGPGWRVREHEEGVLHTLGTGFGGIVLTVVALFPLLWLTHWLQGPDLLDWLGGRILVGLIKFVLYLVQSAFRAMGFVADIILYVAAIAIVGFFVHMTVSRLRVPPLMWYLEKKTSGANLPGRILGP